MTTMKLSQLTIDPANVRKTARGAEPKYAASIQRRGVLIPLRVRPGAEGGKFFVTDGGERFEALEFLKTKKLKADGVAVTDDYAVPIVVANDDEAAARSASLTLNLIRSDMHPVDEFEAFAQMIQDGATLEGIAAEYAMKPGEVRQALSLAAIAPEIRKAWRAGKIGGEAAEAYAQTKDLQHQVRAFEKLKSRAGDAWAVKQEISGANHHQIAAMLKFVGQKEYEAAGHHVNPSLFDDDDRNPTTLDNVPALVAMARRKLDDECERLKKDGWGWAVQKDDAPNDLHAWRRLPAGNHPKEKKALAGCVVDVDYSGGLSVERGYIKPGVSVKIEKTAAQKAAARKAGPAKPATVDAALASRMSEALTSAAATVIAGFCDPDAVLRIAIAGLVCTSQFSSSPVRLEHKGMLSRRDDRDEDYDFADEIAKLAKVGRPALLKQFASIVGMSVDLRSHDPGRLLAGTADGDGKADAALANFVPQKEMQKALRATFDVGGYFDGAPAAMALAALADMGVEPLKNAKKAALAGQAAEHAKKSGWLPPQLRTKGYEGPKAKAAPPVKKPAKTAAKKRRA